MVSPCAYENQEGAQQGLGALQRADILLHEGHRLQAALHNHTVGRSLYMGYSEFL
mgnify:CR=1 FL=1